TVLNQEHAAARLVLRDRKVSRNVAPVSAAAPKDGVKEEEKVKNFLKDNPNVYSAKGVASATGVKPWHLSRMQLWNEHEENGLDEFLATSRGQVSLKDVENRFGWSDTKTSGMVAWRKYREKASPRKKERLLGKRTADLRPDDDAPDPTKPIMDRERL